METPIAKKTVHTAGPSQSPDPGQAQKPEPQIEQMAKRMSGICLATMDRAQPTMRMVNQLSHPTPTP